MVAAGAVPAPVASRVRRVDQVVRDTIPRLPSLGAGSPQAYSVMATATDYLPEAVGGYLRLPRQFADNRPVDRGKSSLMVLIDQLDLLAATMDKVFDAVCRADADALVAHGRFLSEKFGSASTGGALDVGSRRPPMPRLARAARMPVGSVVCSRRPGGTPHEPAAPPSSPPRTADAGRGRRRGGRARLDRRRRRRDRPRRGPGPRRRRGRVRAGGRRRLGDRRRWREHPGLLRRREPWPPLARGADGDPAARSRPSGPRTRAAYAQALAEVAAAACELGEPTMRVIGNASVAAAAQLSVVRPDPPTARPDAVPRPCGLLSPTAAQRRVAVADAGRRQPAAPTAPAPGRRRRGASTSCWPSSTPSSGCSGSSARSTGRSPCCGSRSCGWMPA